MCAAGAPCHLSLPSFPTPTAQVTSSSSEGTSSLVHTGRRDGDTLGCYLGSAQVPRRCFQGMPTIICDLSGGSGFLLLVHGSPHVVPLPFVCFFSSGLDITILSHTCLGRCVGMPRRRHYPIIRTSSLSMSPNPGDLLFVTCRAESCLGSAEAMLVLKIVSRFSLAQWRCVGMPVLAAIFKARCDSRTVWRVSSWYSCCFGFLERHPSRQVVNTIFRGTAQNRLHIKSYWSRLCTACSASIVDLRTTMFVEVLYLFSPQDIVLNSRL
jgi:hypothetical protein